MARPCLPERWRTAEIRRGRLAAIWTSPDTQTAERNEVDLCYRVAEAALETQYSADYMKSGGRVCRHRPSVRPHSRPRTGLNCPPLAVPWPPGHCGTAHPDRLTMSRSALEESRRQTTGVPSSSVRACVDASSELSPGSSWITAGDSTAALRAFAPRSKGDCLHTKVSARRRTDSSFPAPDGHSDDRARFKTGRPLRGRHAASDRLHPGEPPEAWLASGGSGHARQTRHVSGAGPASDHARLCPCRRRPPGRRRIRPAPCGLCRRPLGFR